MQKEELTENISWRDLLHIWSSQTCSFTSWSLYHKETSHTKEHWWRFKRSSETTMGRSLICEIWQEQKNQPPFGYNPNRIPTWSNKNSSIHSLLIVLGKVTVLIHGIFLHAIVQMGVLRWKLLVFINHTVQWHIQTHSESTLILQICIDSLPWF